MADGNRIVLEKKRQLEASGMEIDVNKKKRKGEVSMDEVNEYSKNLEAGLQVQLRGPQ
jgi:hypothetical protein